MNTTNLDAILSAQQVIDLIFLNTPQYRSEGLSTILNNTHAISIQYLVKNG